MKRSNNISPRLRFLAGLAILAANAAYGGGGTPLCADPDAQIVAESCVQTSDAETGWRCIGRQANPAASCPVPPAGWSASKLFALEQDPLPDGLGDYCLYERHNGNGDCGDLQELPLLQVDADVMVVAGMSASASTLKELVADPYRKHFLRQAGQPGTFPTNLAPKVRIAIVDSQVDALQPFLEPQSLSPHGYTLVHMARDLVCLDQPDCGIEVSSSLALPFRCFDAADCIAQCGASNGCPDESNGGYLGTPSSVATAIRRAVANWHTSGVNRLVINLSVGWNPLFDDTDGSERVTSQALTSALEYASCHGALVIAAAGNIISGPEAPRDPLSPGDLEQIAAPDFATCQVLLANGSTGPDPTDFPPGIVRPLLHAAGAVRVDDTVIQTRLDGEPRLVAYGDHAVGDTTPGPVGTATTATQTGTSISSLIVAAASAAAWYHDPAQSPADLLALVYESGRATPRNADFCLDGPPCGKANRVLVCAAIEAICAGSGMGCPTAAALDCVAPLRSQPVLPLDEIEALFDDKAVGEIDVAALTMPTAFPDCAPGYTLMHEPGADLSVPCPHRQYYGIQATPWAKGQPNGQNCEDCPLSYRSPGKLYIEINADFEAPVSDATLICGSTAYRLPGTLAPGEMFRVTGIPESCRDETLRLAFSVADGSSDKVSVAMPLLLIEPDVDFDGMQDDTDNCQLDANPTQYDADDDGFGNRCDTDINGDCQTNFLDLGLFRAAFFTDDAVADFDESGNVNFLDLGIFKERFLQPPGPSGLPNGCN